ncbi:transcriptional repressor NrdR [Candidatus Woesearchaeota archaeon]|jgi:transcriptional repressor NrdR|nr:transcriptional repressor NrdR [Candidatus Woesearchaeota archaeon]MBT4110708.1 transcriptional repressor NrdR [Candidatus Woesearchaeota archaeon]MBT4336304.1 transcriptional repressor NrdR [Candidatus Woesearchaeota archaeon]MBT4469335.1 transcriptional repressor NrdR [Candidatus Woesearchaeota archaeon]MBT6743842.1 transcriptional repressor NrdR [Candidatus Woesearchaeota archaeon]
MYCPFCSKTDTKVLESRLLNESIRRRRECLNCTNRFTTYEKAKIHFKVIKRDGKEQEFNLKKIEESVSKACGKTPEEILTNLTKKIEMRILNKKMNPLKTSEIGKVVLKELKKHDKISYLRFASVHKEIDDPEILKKEINTIIKGGS